MSSLSSVLTHFFIQWWVVHFHTFVYSVLFQFWYPALTHGGQEEGWMFLRVSSICWDLFHVKVCQFWRKLHQLLRIKYILLCLGEIVYKCLLCPIDLWYYLASAFLFHLCLDDLHDLFIGKSWVSKSSTITM